ncbi:hypothetical protein EDB92DRAFT_1352862 [Lactarius akahatsu]|uniref:Uncharacterized protein n=1 Tax=Lactarius akahatsu TaxID=416441 RepID=A0AAD4QAU7_9AGAM|nr:hypothetical protein EDB92DRAFT_1352862 [Lactarius akahatsu]
MVYHYSNPPTPPSSLRSAASHSRRPLFPGFASPAYTRRRARKPRRRASEHETERDVRWSAPRPLLPGESARARQDWIACGPRRRRTASALRGETHAQRSARSGILRARRLRRRSRQSAPVSRTDAPRRAAADGGLDKPAAAGPRCCLGPVAVSFLHALHHRADGAQRACDVRARRRATPARVRMRVRRRRAPLAGRAAALPRCRCARAAGPKRRADARRGRVCRRSGRSRRRTTRERPDRCCLLVQRGTKSTSQRLPYCCSHAIPVPAGQGRCSVRGAAAAW